VEVKLPTLKPGDELWDVHFNVIYDAIKRLQLSVGENSGIDLDSNAGGMAIGLGDNDGFWIKLTARSGNSFAWTEQIPQTGGTWVDGYQSGTTGSDPAHEANANTSLPTLPHKVWAWRAPASNEVVFLLGSC
jgi:hypothetical protein